MISELHMMVTDIHRRMSTGHEQTAATGRQAFPIGNLEQAASVLRIEDERHLPIPEEAVNERENSQVEEEAGRIEHPEEGQPSEGLEAVRPPEQLSEPPPTNAQPCHPIEYTVEGPGEEPVTTTPNSIAAEKTERWRSHSRFRESKKQETELTVVTTSLQTLQANNEPFQDQNVVPTRLSPPLALQTPFRFDSTLPRCAEVGSRPPTFPDETVVGLRSVIPPDRIRNIGGSKYQPKHLDEQLQLDVNLVQKVQNTDHSSQPLPSRDGTRGRYNDALPTVGPAPDSSTLVDLDTPACTRLISNALSPHEVIPLIEAIFTSKDEIRMIRDLRRDDAQTFIDVIYKVRSAIYPSEAQSDYPYSSRFFRFRTFTVH
ncbi:hypothetical protein BDM02DRAFT_497170 [Thelephora ganbajun]|uniref:Uncharacterized protein n=1 Tax=Thelephora ganbajun TaxID=370292 RepID=A0ACB6Z723_THEGA|nr:hypothetical protein BDM02DRAFT_497170 [Thelephora ganbajun]